MKLNNNDDSHNSGLNLLIYNMLLDIESHPAWVCGLKPLETVVDLYTVFVTPCVGVWIETLVWMLFVVLSVVTPCVGVWIETYFRWCLVLSVDVTPCVGVWIETLWESKNTNVLKVTPCVGVWIETGLKAYHGV